MEEFIKHWKNNELCISWMNRIIEETFAVYHLSEYDLSLTFCRTKYVEILEMVYTYKIYGKFNYHTYSYQIPDFLINK